MHRKWSQRRLNHLPCADGSCPEPIGALGQVELELHDFEQSEWRREGERPQVHESGVDHCGEMERGGALALRRGHSGHRERDPLADPHAERIGAGVEEYAVTAGLRLPEGVIRTKEDGDR
jgi:hypothetical protein